MYSVFAHLLETRGVKIKDVCAATGIAQSTISEWKNGKYALKADKLKLIAEFFDVSLDYLMTGEEPQPEEAYYLNEETARIAQQIFDDPDLRVLFDAAEDAKPEDLQMAAEMLRRFKATNREG